MSFSTKQLKQHEEAANKLNQIMRAAFMFICNSREEIDEFAVREFIKMRLRVNGMISDNDNPIVAFGPNTSHIHYFPQKSTALKLADNQLILIDLWAKLNKPCAPFADITWMGYSKGCPPKDYLDKFGILLKARDIAISYIRGCLKMGRIPIAGQIDNYVREFLGKYNLRQHFLHTTGHPIGITSAHGRKGGGIWIKNDKPLQINIPYTIEPGLYFKDDHGFRSEIDFYINDQLELVITTTPQTKITLI